MSAPLEVRSLSVSFGGLHAVEDVSFTLEGGSITGLIGPNGAGKTTTIDGLCGFVDASGSVLLDGQPLDELPPHRRAQAGLARTFQSIELFDDLTVAENLRVAASDAPWWATVVDLVAPRRSARQAEVHDVLELVGIADLADMHPPELSHGRRRLVSVARALAGRPRVLLLDEPAAGLDPQESAEFATLLRRIRDHGVTVLLVDHDMTLVLNVCERLVVLDVGRVIADGETPAVSADAAVTAAYLGTEL